MVTRNQKLSIKIIEELEERLRKAMVSSNVPELDWLIHDRLIFVDPQNSFVSKSTDIEAHSHGDIVFTHLQPTFRKIEVHDRTGIVSVCMDMAGAYFGQSFSGRAMFTRTWAHVANHPRVVGLHMSLVDPSIAAAEQQVK